MDIFLNTILKFRESLLIHDETKESKMEAFLDAKVNAHEIAHQFFGNLVTSDWWNELWLNEGMSNLMTYNSMSQVTIVEVIWRFRI